MEMAILTPLLFLLTLGAFELGRGVWTKHTLSHAAREAARYASVRSLTSDDPATAATIEARAKQAAVGIDASLMTVTTTWNPSNQQGERWRAIELRLRARHAAAAVQVAHADEQLAARDRILTSRIERRSAPAARCCTHSVDFSAGSSENERPWRRRRRTRTARAE
jgi:hypothetical protein